MFKAGDLVRWFMLYDIGTAYDSGIGVIIETLEFNFDDYEFVTYKVFRNEHSDIMLFEEHAIEIFKE